MKGRVGRLGADAVTKGRAVKHVLIDCLLERRSLQSVLLLVGRAVDPPGDVRQRREAVVSKRRGYGVEVREDVPEKEEEEGGEQRRRGTPLLAPSVPRSMQHTAHSTHHTAYLYNTPRIVPFPSSRLPGTYRSRIPDGQSIKTCFGKLNPN